MMRFRVARPRIGLWCVWMMGCWAFISVLSAEARGTSRAVGGLAFHGEEAHCTAFAIHPHWVVSASYCLSDVFELDGSDMFDWEMEGAGGDDFFDSEIFADEVGYVFLTKGNRRTPVFLEKVMPGQGLAYFYLEEPHIAYLERGVGLPRKIIYIDEFATYVTRRIPVKQAFSWRNLFYYPDDVDAATALGAPLIGRGGGYVGVHLGRASKDGSDYGVGSMCKNFMSQDHRDFSVAEPFFGF